jgi:molybdopterin synthase catalytic subunit
MPSCKSQILITTSPLLLPASEWQVSAGAVVDFWGVVRALEDGREISGIDYEAHETMAQHQMETLANRAAADFPLEAIILRHRIGFVTAGEASLFLRVTSGHRAAAFEASQWMICELKKKVPIWKQPVFVRQDEELPNETKTFVSRVSR